MQPNSSSDSFATDREQMVVEQLMSRGVRHAAVLAAMRRIPRERFLPVDSRGRAYLDGAQPIDCDQTISQPYMVGRMTELLDPQPGQTVLEVGTGSGYQTAILACLYRQVHTVEWYLKLMNQAALRLDELGLTNVAYECGDGSLGWPPHAPYDGIIVTAGAPDVPEPLCGQLTAGGRLVVPIGPLGDQTLVLVQRTASGYERHEVLKCRFVKLLGESGWRE